MAEQLPDLRMDRDVNGKTTIMSPTKKGLGNQEAEALGQLYKWIYDSELGEIYSPSTGILLPDGQMRCPDCAWVSDQRIEENPDNADEDWLKIVPNFVIEIKSNSDTINQLKLKMEETWLANGVELGWLLDVAEETVYIFRKGEKSPEVIQGFDNRTLSGEAVLRGFEFELERLLRKKRRK